MLAVLTAGAVAGERLATGTLLVADRGLAGSAFAETVILLLDHGTEGSAGLVVNRPTDLAVDQVVPGLPPTVAPADSLLYSGGPVGQEAVRILTNAAVPGARQVLPRLYVISDQAGLDALRQAAGADLRRRVFAGYAGWAPGQLAAELARGDWRLAQAAPAELFDTAPYDLWQMLDGLPRGDWVLRPERGPVPRSSRWVCDSRHGSTAGVAYP